MRNLKYSTIKYKYNIMSRVIRELVIHCVKTKNKEDQMTLVKTQCILNDYLDLIEKDREKFPDDESYSERIVKQKVPEAIIVNGKSIGQLRHNFIMGFASMKKKI
tara:strand:+ start:4220 stop:4534 length:315 start_codon:yes stop_codon:yes gene_type:complete